MQQLLLALIEQSEAMDWEKEEQMNSGGGHLNPNDQFCFKCKGQIKLERAGLRKGANDENGW